VKKTTTIAALAALVVLNGCTAPPPEYNRTSSSSAYFGSPGSPATVPTNATIKNDQYSPTINVETDIARTTGNGTQIFVLGGRIDRKSREKTAFVQWGEVYNAKAWRFYSRASDDTGTALRFVQVGRNVSSCSGGTCVYSETYNVYLTPAMLQRGASSGISFKIYGRNADERIVNIPASTIAEFNAKMVEAAKR